MRTARFRIELPPGVWIGEVSRAHPDTRFRLLAGVETDDGALELGEVRGPAPSNAADAVRQHPDVSAYDQLFLGDERALARYRVSDVALYDFLRATSVPPEFPVEVEAGAFEIDATANREQLRGMQRNLEASPLDHEVLFAVETRSTDALLTDRQREVLELAVRAGYFEVPRQATLADLAEHLDVDKSTVSGVLRRAQARILDRFLAERAPR